MDSNRATELHKIYDGTLRDNILPFWIDNGVDQDCGGFLTALDRDGSLLDTDKSVWAQGRTTWMFGELFNNLEANETWQTLARHGADFIEKFCFDSADGRMWFHLTKTGQPLRKRRYAFSESFAAIAFGELAQLTGEQRYADLAQNCFEQFIEWNLNPPASVSKTTATRPMRSIGFPMITINTAQELRGSIQLPNADSWIDRSIETIETMHVKDDLQVVLENVSPEGEVIEHFDGRTLNPGHAIEGAWFILAEAIHRNDSRLQQLGLKMLDWMWERGWDKEYGGITYFVDLHGKPVQEYWHDMKFWWPQNEATIATLMAWKLTRDTKYSDWFRAIHEWSFRHLADPKYPEWFGYLHRDGRISVPLKGNLWKGPFHLPRMLLICSQLLAELGSEEIECESAP